MSVFEILNFLLIFSFLLLAGWYLWAIISGRDSWPASWADARRKKKIEPSVRRMERRYRDKARFFTWWLQVERLKRERISGDFAELGVYKGKSARILHHMDSTRVFHLFDTFEGFSREDLEHETGEASTYTPLHFADTDTGRVIQYIKGNQNILIHAGHFPGSAAKLNDCRFALVNLDVDLYNPTRAGLEFFYPRLVPGGVILIHDYNYRWPGIMKAVDEFSEKIPEGIIFIPDIDGTALIVKNR